MIQGKNYEGTYVNTTSKIVSIIYQITFANRGLHVSLYENRGLESNKYFDNNAVFAFPLETHTYGKCTADLF